MDGALPAACEVCTTLLAQGFEAHETVMREEVYAVHKRQCPYDEAIYLRKLQVLVKRATNAARA
jgi:hypothetical protein